MAPRGAVGVRSTSAEDGGALELGWRCGVRGVARASVACENPILKKWICMSAIDEFAGLA